MFLKLFLRISVITFEPNKIYSEPQNDTLSFSVVENIYVVCEKWLERARNRTLRPVANFGKHPLVSTYLVFSAKHPWLTENLVSFEI